MGGGEEEEEVVVVEYNVTFALQAINMVAVIAYTSSTTYHLLPPTQWDPQEECLEWFAQSAR